MGTIAKVTAGGATHLIASTAYGTCATEAATVAKVATIQDSQAFTLVTGVTVHIKFTYTNTAADPTLNVNSTGAKAIKCYGTTKVGTTIHTSWQAGGIVSFTYDGTNWLMNNYIANTDTNTTALGSMSGTLGIDHGGTGKTTAADAWTALGGGASGKHADSYFALASHGNHVPTTGTANNAIFLRNDNTWQTVTPANIGAATSGHTHGLSLAADSGTSSISLAANTKYKLTAGGSTYIFTTPPDNNTTYSSKTAASNGTDVSLVTTGEKYTWNNKSNLAIGTTATTAAAGNHTHTTSIATSSGTNQLTLAANTKYAITAGGTSYVFTTPPDNNTWRGIQNNLTSTATDQSLAAAQGKALNEAKADKPASVDTTISLTSGTTKYNITASGVTTSSTNIVIPRSTITAAQLKVLQKALIVTNGQAANTVKVKCLGTVTTSADIPITVIIIK